MTEQELGGLVFIKARIEEMEERLAELEMEIFEMEQDIGLGSVNMDGMPRGSTPGDPVARMAIAMASLHEQLVLLKAALKERCVELKEKEREIREYIDSVKDEEVKLIIEWRFIDLLDWYEIAGRLEDLIGKHVDRSTPGKKMRKYLQEHEKGPQIPTIPTPS